MEERKPERVIELSRYIPGFLKDYAEICQIYNREEEEITKLYDKIDTLWKSSILNETDIQGLKRFESILGIKPYPGDSLEERRTAALMKWNQQLPYTLQRLKEHLNSVVGKEKYELYVRNQSYELELLLIDQTYRVMQSLREMTRLMLPANLLFIFGGKFPAEYFVESKAENRLELISDFYPRYNREFLYLDGIWELDGTYFLDGYKEMEKLDLYPVNLNITGELTIPVNIENREKIISQAVNHPEMEAAVRGISKTEANICYEGRAAIQNEVRTYSHLDMHLTIENDLWYLDGTYQLDGIKPLDAQIFYYEL